MLNRSHRFSKRSRRRRKHPSHRGLQRKPGGPERLEDRQLLAVTPTLILPDEVAFTGMDTVDDRLYLMVDGGNLESSQDGFAWNSDLTGVDGASDSFTAVPILAGSVDSAAAPLTSSQLVFVDSGVDDYQSLLEGLVLPQALGASANELQVVVLDAERDGVDQITQVLNGQTGVDAIYLLAHGAQR